MDAHAFTILGLTGWTLRSRHGRSVEGARVVRSHGRALGDPLCKQEQGTLGLRVGHLHKAKRQIEGGVRPLPLVAAGAGVNSAGLCVGESPSRQYRKALRGCAMCCSQGFFLAFTFRQTPWHRCQHRPRCLAHPSMHCAVVAGMQSATGIHAQRRFHRQQPRVWGNWGRCTMWPASRTVAKVRPS